MDVRVGTTGSLIELESSVAAPNYAPLPVVLQRGEGSWLWDADGKRYLDFMSAYSAVSHGHAHPRLVGALIDQAQRVAVTSRAYHSTELGPFLAKLVEVADLDGPARALPASGGCESVETAIKVARRWGYRAKGIAPDRAEIVVARGKRLPRPLDDHRRAQYLMLHFTYGDWASSLRVLTEGPVSSHYLVRDDPVRIYGLVDESRRAWHAGVSSWKGQTALNAASIGIEIVNAGNRLAPEGIEWQDYPPAQIDAVVDLVKWIVKRHEIRPDRILGHSDIAPLRKVDPGPKFPWKRLSDEGLIPWPDDGARR